MRFFLWESFLLRSAAFPSLYRIFAGLFCAAERPRKLRIVRPDRERRGSFTPLLVLSKTQPRQHFGPRRQLRPSAARLRFCERGIHAGEKTARARRVKQMRRGRICSQSGEQAVLATWELSEQSED